MHFSPARYNFKRDPPSYNFNGFVAASPAQSFLLYSTFRSIDLQGRWFPLRGA